VRHLVEVDLAGGVCLLGQAGHDVGGLLQTRVVDYVAFEDLRQNPIEPNELRVIELREFPYDDRLVGRAPQCCYLDEPTSEVTNDVCIRWNAPLAWIATYLSTTVRA
jgi:hypothetical protein